MNIKLKIGLFSWLMTLLLSFSVLASQVSFQSLEEQLNSVTIVLQVNVESVEKGNTYMTLKDGTEGPITSSYMIMKGTVENIIWGETTQTNVTMKKVWIVPIQYDENGKELMHMSFFSTGSDLDHQVAQGTQYLFSFNGIGEGQEILHPSRTDLVKDKDKIVAILKNIHNKPQE